MKILLFLLNFNGALGFSGGSYAPDTKDLNVWLLQNERAVITPSYTLGVEARTSFLERFLISVTADWFKRKPDTSQVLEMKYIDGFLGYRIYLLPALLYFYINAGCGFTMVSYQCPFTGPDSLKSVDAEGTILGPVAKASIKFIPTPRLAIELSGGYRYMKSSDFPGSPMAQDSTGALVAVPMNLSGVFLKLSLLREFGTITSY